jgi:hypothetical protein
MQKQLLLSAFILFMGGQTLHAQASSMLQVYEIFQNKCISCHDHASPEAGLDLEGSGTSDYLKAYGVAQQLRNATPSNAHAAANGLKRIYPGRPDKSFLFKKINSGFEPYVANLHANEGSSMPAYPGTQLTELEKEVIRQWILYGAKSSGIQFDKSVLEDYYAGNGNQSFPSGPPPAPDPSEGFQIKMGPFYLEPDGEVEYYQKLELDLPADVEVDRVDIKISSYSHHYIIYNFESPAGANQIPHGLRLNSFHNDINLVAAVQEATNLELPEGTAFKWSNDLVLDLNSHYINYSLNQPYQCEAYVNVYTKPVGTAEQEMFATLLVNPSIPIPNNGNLITHTDAAYQFGTGDIYIWGLMGHTHKYGTGYKVWRRLANGQKGELLYDASCPGGIPGCPAPYFDYQHIPLRYWEPELLSVNWNQGIVHEATWVNDGPSSVNFGPTSDDEMMVLIAFYTLEPVTVGTEDDLSNNTELAVWPVPSSSSIYIQSPDANGFKSVRVFDLAGRQVLEVQNAAGPIVELNVSTLPKGMYVLKADQYLHKIVVE